MIKKIMIGVVLVWQLGGCSQNMTHGAPPYAAGEFECDKQVLTLTVCDGDKNNPKVDIYTDTMKFEPEIVCVLPGTKIKFTLIPPPQNLKGSAAIIPKNPLDTWLVGTNAQNPKKIDIDVPDWVSTKTDHDYIFITSTGKCVDPRVEVVE